MTCAPLVIMIIALIFVWSMAGRSLALSTDSAADQHDVDGGIHRDTRLYALFSRSRAIDRAGTIEAWPIDLDSDTHTIQPEYRVYLPLAVRSRSPAHVRHP